MRAPTKRQKRQSFKMRRPGSTGQAATASSGQKRTTYVIEDGQHNKRWLVNVIDRQGRLAGTLGYDVELEARCACALLGGQG